MRRPISSTSASSSRVLWHHATRRRVANVVRPDVEAIAGMTAHSLRCGRTAQASRSSSCMRRRTIVSAGASLRPASVTMANRAVAFNAGFIASSARFSNQLPNPASGPGVREETGLRYKVNGSADMTDLPLVRA